MKKVLPIRKNLYLGYKLLFLFDNITIYLIYKPDILQVVYMKKNLEVNKYFLGQDSL